MAIKAYYGDKNNVAREIKKGYRGVNGVAREITKGYRGVNGVARQCFKSGTPISEVTVGDTVYMNVNGVSTEFIVVHKGYPDGTGYHGFDHGEGAYDVSCEGVWLLMKDIYEIREWNTRENDYENSTINTYLNGEFFGLFDSGIRPIIKSVKIPYYKGLGQDIDPKAGSDGLSVKIFLLSRDEIGTSILDFFHDAFNSNGGSTENLYASRVAYYNGTAAEWYLRTPSTLGATAVDFVRTDGTAGHLAAANKRGIRPALILPSDALIDDAFNVIA